jgi:LCP family protein required for cell wall assembly
MSDSGGIGTRRTRRGARPSGLGKPRRSRGKRVARIAGITAGSLILVTAGTGAWLYNHLSGNLQTDSLFSGTSGSAGVEKADSTGHTPINILVIGTDSRQNAQDCALGGACSDSSGYGNGDVEMLVHISADRSNATVMSVPRDTVTQIPACKDGKSGASTSGFTDTINSALAYGPGCQVAAVHQLTGIPIDHFMMVDFAGVVNMSDAVGGVQVCVNANVYDTYSHLKLKAGTHTLQGVAALEFLRSRHGFGSGSDLDRAGVQHIFLSALIRKMKSAGTLSDPTALYSLANAATKALTVDPGLGSVGDLLGLANDMSKLPTNRITFTTMQNYEDPNNRAHVLVSPSAKSLFAAIANDQSLSSGGSGSASASPSASVSASPTAPATASSPAATTTSSAAAPAGGIAVHVENASGLSGRAADVAQALITDDGFNPATYYGNYSAGTLSRTQITYGAGEQAEAQTLASAIGLPSSRLSVSQYAGVRLLIGTDWPSGTSFGSAGGASAKPAPVSTQQALAGASSENAATTGNSNCAQVGTLDTVEYDGTGMTPTQAYAAAAGKVPDSAP